MWDGFSTKTPALQVENLTNGPSLSSFKLVQVAGWEIGMRNLPHLWISLIGLWKTRALSCNASKPPKRKYVSYVRRLSLDWNYDKYVEICIRCKAGILSHPILPHSRMVVGHRLYWPERWRALPLPRFAPPYYSSPDPKLAPQWGKPARGKSSPWAEK